MPTETLREDDPSPGKNAVIPRPRGVPKGVPLGGMLGGGGVPVYCARSNRGNVLVTDQIDRD